VLAGGVMLGMWAANGPAPATPAAAPLPLAAPETPVVEGAHDGAWRAVATEPKILRYANPEQRSVTRREPTATGEKARVVFNFEEGNEAEWKLRKSADGTQMEQTKAGLKTFNLIILGEALGGSIEWTFDLECEETGKAIGLAAANRTAALSMFGRFNTTGEPSTMRVVAFPAPGGYRFLSMRRCGASTRLGSESVPSNDGTCNLGFFTDALMRVRNFRYRLLPPEWKPANDPDFKDQIKRDPKLIGPVVPW
jgi:hypothetical protein